MYKVGGGEILIAHIKINMHKIKKQKQAYVHMIEILIELNIFKEMF